jgi:hypothetical protein
MSEDENKLISMTSKHSQKCISCSKIISLIEKETFMCSKCKKYFCSECAPTFLDAVNCPGGIQEIHEPIMVKITRSIKEYAPLGISIDQIEKIKNSPNKSNASIKVISEETNKNEKPQDSVKPRLKILDDN